MTGTASGAGIRPVTVVGSGPVALAQPPAVQRAHRPVRLAAWPPPEITGVGPTPAAPALAPAPSGVEAVPAPLLTLLLELGIHPRELDVEELHRHRFVAWKAVEPGQPDGPEPLPDVGRRPHRARGAAGRPLAAGAELSGHPPRPTGGRARPGAGGGAARRRPGTVGSGRPVGGRRFRPPRAWVASTSTVARGDLDGSLRLAAAPAGYGFRLGSASHLTIGWVAPGPPPRTAGQLRTTLVEAGAGWLLDGVVLEAGIAVRQRIASLSAAVEPGRGGDGQYRDGRYRDGQGDGTLRLGDAAFARDALASQGLALGLSDARLSARTDWQASDGRERTADGARRHVRSLIGVLDSCRHRDEPAWRAYAGWIRALDARWS